MSVEVVACAGVVISSRLGSMQVIGELVSSVTDDEEATGSEWGVDKGMSVVNSAGRAGVGGGESGATE